MRAFLAIEIPKEIREKMFALGSKLPGKLSRVSAENIHITLQFLGEVEEEKMGIITEALKKISATPFKVSIKGLSYFGEPKIHTVFCKVIDQNRASSLYHDIEKRMDDAGLGFKSERDYVPHATIARVKEGSDELKAFINQNSDTEFGELEVNSICLKKSVLSDRGPSYSTLYEHKF